jgi:hypothetical protein
MEGKSAQLILAEHRQVGSLRHVLPQQAINVLVNGLLLGAVWISKVDRCAGLLGDFSMAHKLAALIVSEGLANL